MPAQDIRLFDDGLVGPGVLEPREAGGFALDAVLGEVRSLILEPLMEIREYPAEETTCEQLFYELCT